MHQLKTIIKKKDYRKDCIAFFTFFVIFGFILLRLPYGVGITDEGFYYTVVQRVLRGDRLIADEWQITQLNSLLEIIPYKLSLLLSNGTTEGLLLHIRYFFVIWQMLLGAHLWRRLRRYGYPALIFILTVCTFGPHYTFVYYNMALDGAVLVCTELFTAKKPASRLKLVILGIVTALVVLSELLLTFAYIGFTLQVLVAAIRKKRGKARERFSVYTPTVRTWLWMTVGIALTAAVFFWYLMTSFNWDVRFLIDSIPNMFTDYEYNYSLFGQNSHLLRVPVLLISSSYYFGFAVFALAFATLFYAVRSRKRGMRERQRKGIFLFSTLLVSLAYLHAFIMCVVRREGLALIYYVMISGFSLPIMLYCAILLLISNRPHPRWFAFWQTGVVLSLIVDITSDACLGYGGVIALLPTAILLRDLSKQFFAEWKTALSAARPELAENGTLRMLREGFRLEWTAGTKKETKKRKNKKTIKKGRQAFDRKDKITDSRWFRFLRTNLAKMTALSIVCFAAVFSVSFWVGENIFMRTMNPFVERFAVSRSLWEPMDRTIGYGPLRGIRTTEKIGEIHNRMIQDADFIKENTDGPFYIDSRCPVPYIHVNLPVGNYSTWYVEEDNPERVLYYWRLYPERIPQIIYVPYYEATDYRQVDAGLIQEKLERLHTFFDCEEKEGQAGCILFVRGVKTLEWTVDKQ